MAAKKKTVSSSINLEAIEDLQTKIVSAVRAGNFIDDSLSWAGLDRQIFDAWMQIAKQAEFIDNEKRTPEQSLMVAFKAQLSKAKSEAVIRNLTIIQEAAKDKWQAAAWFLERSDPARWAKIDRLQAIAESQEEDMDSYVDDLAKRRAMRRSESEFSSSTERRSQPRRRGRNN